MTKVSPIGWSALAIALVIVIGSTYFRSVGSTDRTPAQNSSATTITAPQPAGANAVSPLPGNLLIADEGNNRIIEVTPDKKIVWWFPRPGDLAMGQRFFGPDDAFFTPTGKTIITNEEDHAMINEIDVKTHKIVWSYGHFNRGGYGDGYVNKPDDAYRLPNGWTTVAGISNCVIDFLSPQGHLVRRYGTPTHCSHNPPYQFNKPNGDTPLPDGGMLVSEIRGHYIDKINANGDLVWSVQAPGKYPSDPQLMANGDVLYVTYTNPGAIYEITSTGRVVWSYAVASGPGRLDKPSLAIPLPNGNIALNDDANHRVIVIDPKTNKIVWQYGVTGVAGSTAGYLNNPDGIQLVRATPSALPGDITAYFSVPAKGDIAIVTGSDRRASDLKLTTTLHVGGHPQREALSPDAHSLIIVDQYYAHLIVIDTQTKKVAHLLSLPGVAHDLVFSPDGIRLYVTVPGKSALIVFDTSDWHEISKKTLPVSLAHIALSPDGRYLWGTVDGPYQPSAARLLRLDLSNGNVKRFNAGGNAHHLSFYAGPNGIELWVDYNTPDLNLDRRLGFINPQTPRHVRVTDLPKGAYPGHFAEAPVAADDGLIWLPGRGSHPTLWGVDPRTGTAIAGIRLVSPVLHGAISPLGLFFAADNRGQAQVIDLKTRQAVETLPISDAFDVVVSVPPRRSP